MAENEMKFTQPKRQSLRQRLEDFSEYTTCHGLRFVIGAERGIFRRLVWLAVILTGVGMLTNQVITSYRKFKDHEHVITKEIDSSSGYLTFPAVTVCNVNMMKKSKIIDTDAQIYLDQLNVLKKSLSFSQGFSNKMLNNSFDIEKAVLKNGHSARDMIYVCTWGGELCSHLNVTTSVSQIYGLCHTFNSGRQGHSLLSSYTTKRTKGLHLLIDITKDEYYGFSSYFNTGIRVVIHDQNEEPMAEVQGIDVMPGHMTTMNIQKTEYVSLPPPFKSACDSRKLTTSQVYSRSTCLLECRTREVIQKCGCRLLGMPDLPEFNGTKHCNPKEGVDCGLFANISSVQRKRLEDVMATHFITYDNSIPSDNDNSAGKCNCPKKCNQIDYTILQLNTVQFLSDWFWNDYLEAISIGPLGLTKDQAKAYTDKKKTYFRDNAVLLIVYFNDLNIHKTIEKEAYDMDDFGSDVGGYLGLFLGCSILTFCELLDFIITYLSGKRKEKKTKIGQTIEVKECKPEIADNTAY